MAALTRVSYYFKKGKIAEALALVGHPPTELFKNILISGNKVNVKGYILHVAKGKTMRELSFTKTMNEKKTKMESTYYRLVFCR